MRKRIAILAGQADEGYQDRFITGFLKKAHEEDFDVFTFSMYYKYQNTPERERGDANIFSLVNYDMFDAMVIMKDTIQTGNLIEDLEKKIHEKFDGPVICIEKESEYFPSVCTDGYNSIVSVITHLIEVHGYKDIAFLTGKKWHPHSQLRLKAFLDTMNSHGYRVPDDRVIYGDFWYKSGEVCVEQLLNSGSLPEAIACANDQMAIGVCDELTKRGYSIPEDIAVVGFDSVEEGRTSPCTLTSTMLAATECGEYAEQFLSAALRGETIPEFDAKDEVLIGRSCGCVEDSMISESALRAEWPTDISEEGYFSTYNTLADDLMKQTSIMDFLSTVYEYSFQLKNARSFHICLQRSIVEIEEKGSIHLANDGYEPKMIHALKYNASGVGGHVGLDELFDTEKLLPGLDKDRDECANFFITPFFFEDECFGYTVINYGERSCTYGDLYRKWMGDISRGFEGLRRSLILRAEEVRRMTGQKNYSDQGTMHATEKLSDAEKEEMKLVEKILDDNLFTYYFQPMIKVSDGSVFAYEALMRATTEPMVSPLTILKYAEMMGRLVDVEKHTFLNVLAYIDANPDLFPGHKIFINSIPGVKLDDDVYKLVESLLLANSKSVVIELTEEAELTSEEVDEMKERYEKLGIQTAVDDYGTGYSNVTNLIRYMPDFVKIDRSLITDIQDKPQKQYFVREIIGFCHENNMLALAEGVENSDELKTVIQLGVDLVQGYYTAKPGPKLIESIPTELVNEIIGAPSQDLSDGSAGSGHTYIAGRTNRVSLSTLIREGYKEIRIGEDNPVYRDITIVGTPGVKSEVRVTVVDGFSGEITLENAYLFGGEGGIPAIDIGDDSVIKLILKGENTLSCGGIRVPGTSALEIYGTGNLLINLDDREFYGIGNGLKEAHGNMVLAQAGEISIEASGKKGVCIGSGLGGSMELREGKFVIEVSSDTCVGIGSVAGEVNPDIHDCFVNINMSVFKGACIGSVDGDVSIVSENASLNAQIEGGEVAFIGSVTGNRVKADIWGVKSDVTIRSDVATYVGSLGGGSDIRLDSIQANINIYGNHARFLGGQGDHWTDLIGSDVTLDIETRISSDELFSSEDIDFSDSKYHFTVNGSEYVPD
ncbi:MAG: EAL domain-containing protein [Eubacterium sp.]|nr:EAL domain-containing protein [Eubacterium sp.]